MLMKVTFEITQRGIFYHKLEQLFYCHFGTEIIDVTDQNVSLHFDASVKVSTAVAVSNY